MITASDHIRLMTNLATLCDIFEARISSGFHEAHCYVHYDYHFYLEHYQWETEGKLSGVLQ